DGAERRIDRTTKSGRPASGTGRDFSATSRGPGPRARIERDREGGERSPRRYEREDRFEREDRRPRPAGAGRDAPRRDNRSSARPERPSRGEDDRSFSRAPRGESERRPFTRDARPGSRPGGAGASRGPRGETRGRPEHTERTERSGRPLPPSKGRNPGARTGRAPRELSPEEIEKRQADAYGRQQGWGGVARKGGMNIKSTGQAMDVTPSTGHTPDPLSQWVEEVRPVRAPAPSTTKVKAKYSLPGDVAADVRKAFIGTAYMREKMVITLTKAAEGYDRKRYEEALRLGRIVSDAVPGVAPVRELTGLAAYRAERWNMAKIHLRAHFAITGDPEHLPLVMDCDRANRRFRAVEKTYAEVEENEPSADVIAEARIVMASSLADQQRYVEAIDLLVRAGGTKILRNPAYRHVRMWYALADIFDRSGDQVSARELFARVVVADADAYDAQARLNELGAGPVKKNRKRRTTPVSKKKVD
ncbi:MAG: hypothetical protein PXZ08_06975, partial [Actinomycetota bacterium]|nr:hypothetical protein [Actinomycetota bacterium]